MTRTYLLHIRLSIAVSAVHQGLALTELSDPDREPLWELLPDESLLLSTVGDTILMAYSSPLAPAEVLKYVLGRFQTLPVEDASVLQIGAHCRASDESDPAEVEDETGWWHCYSVVEWLKDGRLLFDNRPSFGPKALILTTEYRCPTDLQSVRHLRKVLPEALPHWHGRNSLMLALATDGDVNRLWAHHTVQRLLTDREVSFAACFEIGPEEANLHGLGLVLPGCQRLRRSPRNSKSDGASRTVTVEYAQKRSWEKVANNRQSAQSRTAPPRAALRSFDPSAFRGQIGDQKSPPAANESLPEANDNRLVTEIKVPRSARRGHRRT